MATTYVRGAADVWRLQGGVGSLDDHHIRSTPTVVSPMNIAGPVVGTVLIVFVLRELFHTLFHPVGRGFLQPALFSSVWWLAAKRGQAGLRLAGPLAMVLVIAAWAGLLVVGWALISWPFLPQDFVIADGLDTAVQGSPLDALYLSVVTQATLGYGDITPVEDALRFAAAAQAVIGFGVFTAAITWVLSIYPALGRQRATAGLISTMRAGNEARGLPAEATRELDRVTDPLIACRIDLIQYPATFFFSAPDRASSLAGELPWLARAAAAVGPGDEQAGAAAELGDAIDQFAQTIAEQLECEGAATPELLAAYAARHQIGK